MANFIGLVYATLKENGIDTKGMSTDEAVAKFNELQGEDKEEKKDTPEDVKKKLGEKKEEKREEEPSEVKDKLNGKEPAKQKSIGQYDYEELKKEALTKDDKESRMNLYKWFDRYGSNYWNGEVYEIDKDHNLKPIYQGVGEPDEDGDYEEYEVVDAKIV